MHVSEWERERVRVENMHGHARVRNVKRISLTVVAWNSWPLRGRCLTAWALPSDSPEPDNGQPHIFTSLSRLLFKLGGRKCCEASPSSLAPRSVLYFSSLLFFCISSLCSFFCFVVFRSDVTDEVPGTPSTRWREARMRWPWRVFRSIWRAVERIRANKRRRLLVYDGF